MASAPQELIDSVIGRNEQIARLDDVENSRAEVESKLLMWASGFQSFENHFMLKEGENGTLFVVNREDGTEATFAITGYISQYWLPSSKLNGRMADNVGSVQQRVVISGATTSFPAAQEACRNIYLWMESQSAESEFLDYEPACHSASTQASFMASAPLLSKKRDGGLCIDMPDYLTSCLAGVRKGDYMYTESNEVAYLERSATLSGVTFTAIHPKLFRHCHLVDVQVCFRGIKVKGGKRIFVHHLSGLTLLNRFGNMELKKSLNELKERTRRVSQNVGYPRKRKYEFAVKGQQPSEECGKAERTLLRVDALGEETVRNEIGLAEMGASESGTPMDM